jgi:SAM-dependent methyltransferase
LIDGDDGIRARQLTELGGRVSFATASGPAGFDAPDGSADLVISLWTSFRDRLVRDLAEARRVLRPEGRLLVVHDYGRDDVSRLRGDLPEYGLWSRRDGPFLHDGFRVRVVHCFWTFESLEAGETFLEEAFGAVGREVAAGMKRPRLSYNVAVYHRSFEAGR